MPSLITPPDMPEDVVEAIETLGNRARTEMLRLLLAHGPLTRAELNLQLRELATSGDKKIPERMVWNHLLAMEDAGLVSADVPRGQRQGKTTTWSADATRARQLATRWVEYVEGGV